MTDTPASRVEEARKDLRKQIVATWLDRAAADPDFRALEAAVRSDVLAQVRERIAELHWHYADGRETGMITARDLYAALSDLAEGKP